MWRNRILSYCGNPYIDYNKKILHSIGGLSLRLPAKITSLQGYGYIEITDSNGLAIGTSYAYGEQHDGMCSGETEQPWSQMFFVRFQRRLLCATLVRPNDLGID